MNRTDRLSAILILLQTKKVLKASEIAERFHISLRTVYRDMKALDGAGVPIGAEAGVGYYLIEGYHLPPVMFTPEEAGALLIAGKLVNSFADESVKMNFNLASDKIKSVLPDSHQEFLGEIENQVHVFYKKNSSSEKFKNNFITTIQHAISVKKCVHLQYFSRYKEEASCRIVEPIGLCFYGFNWHLIAYCKLRKDYRDFRLDRIQKLTIDSDCVSDKAELTVSKYFSMNWKNRELMKATVTFTNSIVKQIQNTRYYFGFYEEFRKETETVMNFAIDDYAYIGSWLFSLGEDVTGIEPPELKQHMINNLKQLNKQYISI